ncbi:hypothetical protein PTKIN_Ptkin01aG0049500 [Pterospermum kingtungense]
MFAQLTVLKLGKFSMVMLCIWKHRNDKLWNDGGLDAKRVVFMAIEALCDWLCAKDQSVVHEKRGGRRSHMLWHPPPDGYVKCNVDPTTFTEENQTSFSMMIRDASGRFLVSRTTLCSGTYNFKKSEAMGLAEALSWVHELKMHHAVFESDAKGWLVHFILQKWIILSLDH